VADLCLPLLFATVKWSEMSCKFWLQVGQSFLSAARLVLRSFISDSGNILQDVVINTQKVSKHLREIPSALPAPAA